MAAADDRRTAAEKGKDVTPIMASDNNNKVTRVEQTEDGLKEVEYPIVDLSKIHDDNLKVLNDAASKNDKNVSSK